MKELWKALEQTREGFPQCILYTVYCMIPQCILYAVYCIMSLRRGLPRCLKKNLNAPRLSEHPPVRGKKCQNV